LNKCGEGQFGLARSGEEVENPCRVVVRKKKKKKKKYRLRLTSETKVH
jgi:hypothetical protein